MLTVEFMSGAQLSAHFPERERRSTRAQKIWVPLNWELLTKAKAHKTVIGAQLALTGEIMSGAQLSAHFPEREQRSTRAQKIWAAQVYVELSWLRWKFRKLYVLVTRKGLSSISAHLDFFHF